MMCGRSCILCGRALYDVWELYIMCGRVLYDVWEFRIMCGRALYDVWELCIMCGRALYEDNCIPKLSETMDFPHHDPCATMSQYIEWKLGTIHLIHLPVDSMDQNH